MDEPTGIEHDNPDGDILASLTPALAQIGVSLGMLVAKADDILVRVETLSARVEETAEIASVFKEFGAMMENGGGSVPMLSQE